MTKQIRYVVEHVVEVRHVPLMVFLDRRATIGEHLSEKLRFPQFEIGLDRFDLWNDQRDIQVFASHKNFGATAYNPSTSTLFSDTFKKMLSALSEVPDLYRFKKQIRIGVKSTFFFPWERSFDDLRQNIEKNYGNLTPEALKCFGQKVTDIGLMWDFKDSHSLMATRCGAMRKEQAFQFFNQSIHRKLSNIGLFFLIDIFDLKEQPHDPDKLINIAEKWSTDEVQVFENIVKLIMR